MCGIGGILSGEKTSGYQDRKKFFIEAMFSGTLRGFDSTGIFLVPRSDKGKDIIIRKKNVPAPDFLDMSRMTKGWLTNIDYYNYAIFHNRSATRGATSTQNAHPFEHDDITLVHNGTLNTFLSLTGKDGPTFTVDSEAITWAFNKFGHEAILPELDGAFALVWHDKKDDLLRAIRNTERPLHFATIQKQKTVIMASEGEMLAWLATRNNLKIDTLYTLSPGEMVVFPKEEPNKFDVQKVKLKPKKIVQYHGYGSGGRYSNGYMYDDDYDHNSKSPALEKKKEKENNSNTILKDLGIKVGEVIDFYVDKFKIYNTNSKGGIRYGQVIGTPHGVEDPQDRYEILCHSLKEKEWDWCVGQIMCGNIVSATEEPTSKKINIFVEDITISDYEEEEIPEEEQASKVGEFKKKWEVEETFIGPGGIVYPLKEFENFMNSGCVVCGYLIKQEDYEHVVFSKNSEVICPECISQLGWDTLACNYGVHRA